VAAADKADHHASGDARRDATASPDHDTVPGLRASWRRHAKERSGAGLPLPRARRKQIGPKNRIRSCFPGLMRMRSSEDDEATISARAARTAQAAC